MTIKINKAWEFKETQTYKLDGKIFNVNACITVAKGLEVMEISLNEMNIRYNPPCRDSLRSFVEHMKMVLDADLEYPIILNEDGVIIDGRHRLCKALLEEKETIKAVRFEKDPESCYVWGDD